MLPRLLEDMSSAAQALKMLCPIDMTQMADELIESHLAKKPTLFTALSGDNMDKICSCNICIHHIPVDYAGESAHTTH